MYGLLHLPNKTSILWPFRHETLSEALGLITLWCGATILSYPKASNTAWLQQGGLSRKSRWPSWGKHWVLGHVINYTLTSAARKPLCRCGTAPAGWAVGFAHWGPLMVLFSAFRIPAVADVVLTPVWADFPSSRIPGGDVWNCAISTEQPVITVAVVSSCFTPFCSNASHGYHSESILPRFVATILTFILFFSLSSIFHCETLTQERWKTVAVHPLADLHQLRTVGVPTRSCLQEQGFN